MTSPSLHNTTYLYKYENIRPNIAHAIDSKSPFAIPMVIMPQSSTSVSRYAYLFINLRALCDCEAESGTTKILRCGDSGVSMA